MPFSPDRRTDRKNNLVEVRIKAVREIVEAVRERLGPPSKAKVLNLRTDNGAKIKIFELSDLDDDSIDAAAGLKPYETGLIITVTSEGITSEGKENVYLLPRLPYSVTEKSIEKVENEPSELRELARKIKEAKKAA